MAPLYFLKILVLMCVSASHCYTEEDFACCAPGYVLRNRSDLHCWEERTGNEAYLPLTCHKTTLLLPTQTYFVNKQGQLQILMKNRDVRFEAGTFCVAQQSLLHGRKVGRSAVLCEPEDFTYINDDIYGYCMIVSAVFLLMTAVYYASRSELRNLQGASIINLCCSLAAGFLILSGMKLVPYSDMNLCAARGFFAYFFIIASFFWMNAISIQNLIIMWRESPSEKSEKKELIWYSLYAWGVPTVLTVAMAIVNFIPGDHLKPGIGLNHCWFFDNNQQWWYMYSVMSILLAVNIGIFIYTTYMLWSLPTSTFKDTLKFKLIMTVRLFIVMGIPWIFEMISNVAPQNLTWEVLGVINTLQGVIIFIVLGLCPRPSDNDSHYDLNISIARRYSKVDI